MNERISKWAEVIVRVFLGAVFGYAGGIKLRDPQAFADSIHSFALLPSAWINPVALGLPVLEVVLGVFLLLGLKRRTCAWLAATLSMVFALALSQALIRGLSVDCGCFGSGPPSVVKTLWAIMRDVVLAALAMSWGFGGNTIWMGGQRAGVRGARSS